MLLNKECMIYFEIDKVIQVRFPRVMLHDCTGTVSSLSDASDISVLLPSCLAEIAQGTELTEGICKSPFSYQIFVDLSLRAVAEQSSLLISKMDNEETVMGENQK